MCQAPSTATEPTPAAAAANGKTKEPKERSRSGDPHLVAAKEVVGRKVAVWDEKSMEWPEAVIAQFEPDNGKHLVRFLERSNGSVKHEERWINLAKNRFQWLSDPAVDAAPNPTHAIAPKGDDAVGYRIRIFWPGMARWYQGKVEAYNPDTKRHTVKYRDGDVQKLLLRNEAAVYLEKVKNIPNRVRLPSTGSGGKDRSLSAGGKRSREEKKSFKKMRNGKDGTPAPTTATPPKKRKANGGVRAASTSMSDAEGSDISTDEDGSSSGEEEEDAVGTFDASGEEDSDFETRRGPKVKRKNSASGGPRGPKSSALKPRKNSKNSAARKTSKAAAAAAANMPDAVPRKRGRPPGSGGARRNPAKARSTLMRRDSGPRARGPMRILRGEEEILRGAGTAVVGARVAVFWNEDEAYYKGKLVQFDSYHKRHKVIYDDGEEEWVALSRESFRYLTPRAKSAGCTSGFRQAMAQLGADQEVGGSARRGGHATALQGTAAPRGAVASQPPSPEDASNWQVSLQSAADGRWHRCEILCYDAPGRRHLVLYEDGEDEWVDFSEEEIVWHCTIPEGRQGLFPGKSPGVEVPSGRNAVGWRVSVYWPGDAAFYPGEIASFSEASGQFEVAYDDGEEGNITLSEDKVKWILPPGVAVDHEALERMEVGGGRPRRRVTTNGAESDPDYEFENLTGGVHAGSHRMGRGRGGGGGVGFARLRPAKAGGGGGGHHYQNGGHGNGSPWEPLPTEGSWPQRGNNNHNRMQHMPSFGPGVMPMMGGEPSAPEGFGVEPSVVRHITRVPSFANLMGDTEARLPTAVTVRIYLSGGSSDGSKERGDGAVKKEAVAGEQAGGTEKSPAAAAAGAGGCGAMPSAAAATPQGKLQARLEALDLMARRVGRAQQSIVKGVPTDLPTNIVVPLGVGPPPVRVGAGHLTSGAHRRHSQQASGAHRLSRPSGVGHSPFHPRRSLEEEEESDAGSDEEEREDDDVDHDDGSGNGGDEEDEEDGVGQEGLDCDNGHQNGGIHSSSGSSDDEGDEATDSDDVMVSPRSPNFPRGGKVKPAAVGNGGDPSPQSPLVMAARPAGVAPSPLMPPAGDAGNNTFRTPSDDVNNAAHCVADGGPSASVDLSMAGFPVGDLPASDSVANLLSISRNASGTALLADMPSACDGPDFMDLGV